MLRRSALRLAGRACAANFEPRLCGVAALALNEATQSRASVLPSSFRCGYGRGQEAFHAWAPLRWPDEAAPSSATAGNTGRDSAPSDDDYAASGVVFQAQRVLALRKALLAISETSPTIPIEHLEEICSSKGFSVDKGNMAEALQRAGVVLRVKDKVFLHPDRVVRTALLKIEDQCDVAAGRPTARERLKALGLIKARIDLSAERRTKAVLTGMLGVLFAQLAVFVRLTYWELSWDTIEPAGFFYMSTAATIGQIYFIMHREEFSNESLRDRINGWFRRRLYARAMFDAEAYEALKQRVEEAQ